MSRKPKADKPAPIANDGPDEMPVRRSRLQFHNRVADAPRKAAKEADDGDSSEG